MKNQQQKQEVKVINIMADGSICEDLTTYLNDHELPPIAKRLIVEFIREGHAILAARGGK